MVELLRQWNLYTNTRVRKHHDDNKLLKNVLHRPRQRSLDELRKIKNEEFLEKPLGHIIHFQTFGKNAWTFLELLNLQTRIDRQPTLYGGSQAKRSVVSFSLFRSIEAQHPLHLIIIREGSHFHGNKDPITFFGKYCDFQCHCCNKYMKKAFFSLSHCHCDEINKK